MSQTVPPPRVPRILFAGSNGTVFAARVTALAVAHGMPITPLSDVGMLLHEWSLSDEGNDGGTADDVRHAVRGVTAWLTTNTGHGSIYRATETDSEWTLTVHHSALVAAARSALTGD